eukprot:3579491-Karenia_brevis.AAC.1
MEIATAELRSLKMQITASKPLPDQLHVVRRLVETKQQQVDRALAKYQDAQTQLERAQVELKS